MDNLDIKITGFGLFTFYEQGDLQSLSCGSPLYMAPEVLFQKEYNEKADIFSIGVITYSLLTGEFPYKAESMATLKYKVHHD